MEEKLIRDVKGSPVPQYFNEDLNDFAVKSVDGSTVTRGDVDFSRTKLMRDKLGSPIPQLWDSVNYKWVVDTGQGVGSGSGESGTVGWENIQDKPTTFPSTINSVDGLQAKLNEIWDVINSLGGEGGGTPPNESPELFNGEYITGLYLSEGNGGFHSGDSQIIGCLIPVEQNKKYQIIKGQSDRFKLMAVNKDPRPNYSETYGFGAVDYGNLTSIEYTVPSGAHYIFIYVSVSGIKPSISVKEIVTSVPEEPEFPSVIEGYDFPELNGKKWIHTNGYMFVGIDISSDFYSDSSLNYFKCNSASTLYQFSGDQLSGASTISENTDLAQIKNIVKSNTPLYNDMTLTAITREADV